MKETRPSPACVPVVENRSKQCTVHKRVCRSLNENERCNHSPNISRSRYSQKIGPLAVCDRSESSKTDGDCYCPVVRDGHNISTENVAPGKLYVCHSTNKRLSRRRPQHSIVFVNTDTAVFIECLFFFPTIPKQCEKLISSVVRTRVVGTRARKTRDIW